MTDAYGAACNVNSMGLGGVVRTFGTVDVIPRVERQHRLIGE